MNYRLCRVVGIYCGSGQVVMALADLAGGGFVFCTEPSGPACAPAAEELEAAPLKGGDRAESFPVPLLAVLDKLRNQLDRQLADVRFLLNRACFVVPTESSSQQLAALRQAIEATGFTIIETLTEAEAASAYQAWLGEDTTAAEARDVWPACGAALRGEQQGTTYLVTSRSAFAGKESNAGDLELHLEMPHTTSTELLLAGTIRSEGGWDLRDGGSVLIRGSAPQRVKESFIDAAGQFRQHWEQVGDSERTLSLTLVEGSGNDIGTLPVYLGQGRRRPRPSTAEQHGPTLRQAISVELLDQQGSRNRHVLAPRGARLPGQFCCLCRTVAHQRRVVIPVYEEERWLKTLSLGGADLDLASNTEVELRLQVGEDASLQMEIVVPVLNRRQATAIARPTPPEPEPAADDRNGDLRPEWSEVARLVKDCLILAGEIADQTGRDRQELFDQVYSQERYAEQAFEEKNGTRYRECFTNLMKFANYLEQLQQQYVAQVQGVNRSPGREDVLRGLRHFERELIHLLAQPQLARDAALHGRLAEMRRRLPVVARRADKDLTGAVAEVRQLGADLEEIWLDSAGPAPVLTSGLLAGPLREWQSDNDQNRTNEASG